MSEPRVIGPITGGAHGWAFGAAGTDLAAVGYAEEEFFLEGTAATFQLQPGSAGEFDGRWRAEPADSLPYRTRMIVQRPVDPARFNGTVIVCWNNVTAGFDIIPGQTPVLTEEGFAFVGVTAQAVGVHGFTSAPMGLRAWDADRYGSLSIPSDDASYDIFTQAALAVGPSRSGEPDPLAGLAVERVLAVGASQSAARLHTYLNAVAPLSRVFDGYMLQVHFGGGTPLNMGGAGPMPDLMALGSEPYTLRTFETQLRTDLGVPVMVVNSETETLQYAVVRQPDTEHFRFWEMAGTAHAGGAADAMQATMERDFGGAGMLDLLNGPGPTPNDVDYDPVVDAALHHIQAWMTGGPPPPAQPRIDVTGDPVAIVRDEHDIATGGVRLPDLMVPVATLSSATPNEGLGSLSGSRVDFDVATIRALYSGRDDYLARYEAAIQAGVDAGFLLPTGAERLRTAIHERHLPFDEPDTNPA
ncbi:MAG: alpha/beta hydrolase domain-containing protein [Acidimicrobiia bacterium]